MRTSLPAAVALLVAFVGGLFPVHYCAPVCGEGGAYVLLGTHAHGGHDLGVCGHDHHAGVVPEPCSESDDHGDCCTDAPSASVLPAAKVACPAAPAILASEGTALPAALALASNVFAPDRSGLGAGPPTGVLGIVLLR